MEPDTKVAYMQSIKLFLVLICLFVLISCAPSYTLIPYMKGNCVDRAIVIKQKLESQGYETRLVLGIMQKGDEKIGHIWIEYMDKKSDKWMRIDNY